MIRKERGVFLKGNTSPKIIKIEKKNLVLSKAMEWIAVT